MFKILSLLRNRNFILSLALLLGLFLGQGTQWTEQMVLPALAFVMMLSTTNVTRRFFRSPRMWLTPLLVGITMNYGVLGGLILVLDGFFILEEPLRIGFIVLAAVPPAVAVIPFTSFFGGDLEFSLIGTISCYLGAFIIIPLIFFTLLGSSVDIQLELFITLIEFIIIPLILSYILLRTGVVSRIDSVRGTLINWSFFLVIYTIVGLNRDIFLSQPLSLIPAAIITVVTTFVLGCGIERIGRLLRIDPKRVTSMVLLGTLKNTGFSAGLALILFDRFTAIPSAIMNVSMLSYVILLDLKKRKKERRFK
jgi:BASS family bile acid:Na+ symporter